MFSVDTSPPVTKEKPIFHMRSCRRRYMLSSVNQYVESSNIHGQCDICQMDGSINEVVGGRYLCRGCIRRVDSLADSRVVSDDNECEDVVKVFESIVEENVGNTVILHFTWLDDSPTDSYTYTVENAVSAEIEHGNEDTVRVEKVSGEQVTFTGRSLSIVGFSS